MRSGDGRGGRVEGRRGQAERGSESWQHRAGQEQTRQGPSASPADRVSLY